jgi:putative hydrolase of the HAD superfamily
MQQINHVVFDLGKVLVGFSYQQFLPLLRQHGATFKDIDDFAEQVALVRYELGQSSSTEFLQGINKLLSTPLPEAELHQHWCGIFSPIPQMLDLVRQLKSQRQIYLISNTGEIHWQYLCERFALKELFTDLFASFEVGIMKPAPEIYRLAEQRFGFKAEEAVFIDDRAENVAGALACGWQGIQHLSFGQTRAALLALEVNLPDDQDG